MVSALAPPTMTFAPWPAVTVLAPSPAWMMSSPAPVVSVSAPAPVNTVKFSKPPLMVTRRAPPPASAKLLVESPVMAPVAEVIVDDQAIGPQPAGHRVGAL